VHALAGDHQFQPVAPAVPRGDHAPALHRDRKVAVLLERLGDHVGGGREDLVDVGARHLRQFVGEVRVPLGMHKRGAADGGGRVQDRRQRVDVHVDQVGSVLGQVPGLGHDQGHDVAGEPHVVLGEQAVRRLAGRADHGLPERPPRLVQVGGGEHRDDPGQAGGGAGVDAADGAPGHRAADERRVRHAGHDHVVHVPAAAGQQTRVLTPFDRLSHPPRGCLARTHVPASCSSRRSRAARRTPRMMPW
jgi:hypothetical protein